MSAASSGAPGSAPPLVRMFIGGEWTVSLTGETFPASSPATGEQIATVALGDRDDARQAIAAARAAAGDGRD